MKVALVNDAMAMVRSKQERTFIGPPLNQRAREQPCARCYRSRAEAVKLEATLLETTLSSSLTGWAESLLHSLKAVNELLREILFGLRPEQASGYAGMFFNVGGELDETLHVAADAIFRLGGECDFFVEE